MPISNYPKGFANGVNIRGIPLLNLYPGTVFWVDSVHGSNGNKGTFDRPFASLDYATGRCTDSHGDLVIAKAGHVETISAAGSLTCNVIGVCYYFLGQGSNKAYCSFTATAGTILVTAAGVTFVNPCYVTNIDAVISAVVVSGADFAEYNVTFYDTTAKAATVQLLTTVGAQRMCIQGYRFYEGSTGTHKTSGIQTIGALDGVILEDIEIAGTFSSQPVNLTNAACTNIKLQNLSLNNLDTNPFPALGLHANTTGFAEDVKLRIASGTTYVSNNAKMQWAAGCLGYNTDGSGGSAIGAATDITGAVGSVGTQVSTAQSCITSITTGASAIRADIASQALSVASQATSVGTGTSTCNANVLSTALSVASTTHSVGIGVSTAVSQITSTGLGVSTGNSIGAANAASITSAATSVGIGVSTTVSVGAANAASVLSVGAQVSVVNSVVGANAQSVLSVGTNLSTVKSTVLANAASVASVGTGVSTVISVGAANAASIASVGTGVSTVISVGAANAASVLSVGTQVSVINSVVAANAASITSAATSVGTGGSTITSKVDSVAVQASTAISQCNSLGVMLTSIGLIISAINSKTV